MLIEIILGVIVFIASILLIILIYKNKFNLYIVKIDEAENNVDILLQKKVDLLNKIAPIVNKFLKSDDFLCDLKVLCIKNYSHFELYDILRGNYNDLFNILDDNEKLYKKKDLNELLDELNNNEENLIAAIKFYNNNVVNHNGLIDKFPSNIIRLIFGYKKYDFYKNEKREIFEILKEEKN